MSNHYLAIAVLLASSVAQTQAVFGPPVYGPPVHDPSRDAVHSDGARLAAEMGTGKWWVKLSDEAKDKFVERYTVAMNHVSSTLFTDCSNGIDTLLVDGGLKSGVEASDFVSYMIICKVGSSFDFKFDRKEIREAVDEFYKDSANLTVPIDVALQHVREGLAAKRPHGMGIG